MKKIISLMLITLFSFILISCGDDDLDIEDPQNPIVDPAVDPEIESKLIRSTLSVTGFAKGNVNSRKGVIITSEAYAKVTTVAEFIQAIKNKVKVIEVMNDLDFGWYINDANTKSVSNEIYRTHNSPISHPTLKETGVGRIYIKDRTNGLTIFSKNGSMLKHLSMTFVRCSDIVVRNLKFSELWEWDEATSGDYDRNDWDYITLESCNGAWIDHCTFGKSYDGLIDSRIDDATTKNVTISWCLFDPNIDSTFVKTQFDYLENNRSENELYDYLRNLGLSKDDIIKIAIPQKKGFLAGQSELQVLNNDITLTLSYNHLVDLCDRLPRLRSGDAHVFNCFDDCSKAYEAYKLMSGISIDSAYHFGCNTQAIVTTENGAILAENCHFIGVRTLIKNNQKSSSKPNYTGKAKVINSLCELGKVNETGYFYYIGGTDTNYSYFKPIGASVIPFSFNKFVELPYTYTLYDPMDLQEVINDEECGAGARIINNFNWLSLTYE